MRVFSILIASLLMITLAPAAVADVGVSGQCYDADGNGNGTTLSSDDPSTFDATAAAEALVILAEGEGHCAAEDCEDEADDDEIRQCGTDANGRQEQERRDYLEVHADGTQVCYDGTVRTDGDCPTAADNRSSTSQ